MENLQLSQTETDFLPRLADLMPTPRAAKRFSNLYRLVRIGIPAKELTTFVGTRHDGGAYQAAALLLAILISDAGHARDIVTQLHGAAADADIVDALTSTWGGFRSPREAVVTTSPAVRRLRTAIADLRRDGVAVHGHTGTYQLWVSQVARYSFETYELYIDPGAVG